MKFKDIFFIIYYLLLIVVLQMQQSEVMPSIISRLVYIGAVIWPLITVKRDAMPIVMCLLFTITNYNYSYSYMPYAVFIYDILIAMGLFWGYKKNSPIEVRIPSFLFIWFFLITTVDIVTEFKVYYISYSLIGVMLLWPYMQFGDGRQLSLMSWGFIVAGAVLALNFLLFGGNYAEAYNGGGGFEREGWADPNYFGCAVGFGIVASLVELHRSRTTIIIKLVIVAAIVLMSVCLAINASRGAVLAVGFSGVVLVALSKIKTTYKLLSVFAIVLLLIGLDSMGYFALLEYRIENDSNMGSGRGTIWTSKLEAFFKDGNILNFFLGMGQEGGRRLALEKRISTGFHNDYIAFFCEYGIFCLAIFLIWLYYPIQIAKNNKWIIVAIVGYIATCGLTLEPLTAGHFTYFIFWLYAVQCASCQNAEKSKK